MHWLTMSCVPERFNMFQNEDSLRSSNQPDGFPSKATTTEPWKRLEHSSIIRRTLQPELVSSSGRHALRSINTPKDERITHVENQKRRTR